MVPRPTVLVLALFLLLAGGPSAAGAARAGLGLRELAGLEARLSIAAAASAEAEAPLPPPSRLPSIFRRLCGLAPEAADRLLAPTSEDRQKEDPTRKWPQDLRREARGLEYIASGSFGRVYVAREFDCVDHGPVAVKVFRNPGSRWTGHAFEREIFFLSNLQNKGPFVSFFMARASSLLGVVFPRSPDLIFMEAASDDLLDGIIVHHRTMRPVAALRVLVDALRGVRTMTDMGIVHSDLKPQNLLVFGDCTSEEGCRLKIADFGTACVFDLEAFRKAVGGAPPLAANVVGGAGRTDIHTGASGAPERFSCTEVESRGSPFYMPPEAHRNGFVAGPESDVWSLGLVLFQTFCGSLPFWIDPPSRWNFPGQEEPGKDRDRSVKDRVLSFDIESDVRFVFLSMKEPEIAALVSGMLRPDPAKRLTASEALAVAEELFKKAGGIDSDRD